MSSSEENIMDCRQRQLANIIQGIIRSWKNTNDLSSPTLISDIKEELNKFDHFKTEADKVKLFNEVRSILLTIKYRVNKLPIPNPDTNG